MARKTGYLLALGGAFLVMSAAACPPEVCESFPEFCDEGPVGSNEAQPELAQVEDEPKADRIGS